MTRDCAQGMLGYAPDDLCDLLPDTADLRSSVTEEQRQIGAQTNPWVVYSPTLINYIAR